MAFYFNLKNFLPPLRSFGTKVAKKPTQAPKTFNRLFVDPQNSQNEKVSKEGGFDALFQECMSEIYSRRAEADGFSEETAESPEIEDLTQKEREIVSSAFRRINPKKNFLHELKDRSKYIDPYWDPFKTIEDLKLQISTEFNDLSKLVSKADLYKYKLMIRKSLKEHDSKYEKENVQGNSENVELDYKFKNERFWDPDVDKRLVLQNNLRPFSFRDLHVLHNFVSENGQILPRRINLTTRRQQRQIFRAIKVARQMALFPYDWRPLNRDRIPLIPPKQYLFDELFHKYKKLNDLRSKSMLNILINKYSSINAHRYLKYEFGKNEKQSQ